MTSTSSAILPLPAEVVAQIKSSVAITSMSDVVLGLLGNSLDAGALRVDISVDFGRGGCTVEDDGVGIPPTEFREDGGLGKLYYTSKFHSQTETHGRNGAFLSSVMALSLVTITSHHHLHRSHNTLSIHQTKVISRLMPAPAHQYLLSRDHGTRVVVRDLFGNMPVRVKQRTLASREDKATEAEWEDLKRGMVGTLLAEARELSVVVRDAAKDRKFTIRPPGSTTKSSSLDAGDFQELRSNTVSFDLSLTRSILSQASYITPASWGSWVTVSASTPHLSIEGAMSLDPAPTKQVQFISLSLRPLSPESGNNMLFEEINRMFATSGFGVVDEESDVDNLEKDRRLKDRRYKSDGYTNKQLKGGRKGVDRWPMFFLRLTVKNPEFSQNILGVDEVLNDDSYLKSILELLGVVTTEFLAQNHFRPRVKQKRVLIDNPTSETVSSITTEGRRLRSQTNLKNPPRSPNQVTCHDGGDASAKTRPSITQRPAKPTQTKQGSRRPPLSASRPDILGNNVRVPTFSRDSTHTLTSGINFLSKVKSSRKGFIEDNYGAALRDLASSTPAKAVPRAGSLTSHSSVEDNEGSSNTENFPRSTVVKDLTGPIRLGAGGGGREGSSNVTNRADEMLEDQMVPRPSNDADVAASVADSEGATDTLIHWVNPTTNKPIFINARTGVASLTSKEKKRKAHGSSPASHETATTNNIFNSFKRLKGASRVGSLTGTISRTWIGDLLRDWENPVFKPTEQEIPQVSLLEGTSPEASNILHGHHHGCSQIEIEKAFKESTSTLPGKLSKKCLRSAEVIAQVDKKFILVKASAIAVSSETRDTNSAGELLVLIDQHAADERCRVEDLLEGLCKSSSPDELDFKSSLGFTSRFSTTQLLKPVSFHVSPREHRLFKVHAQHFANWGILYDLALPPVAASRVESDGGHSVAVKTLPPGIAERCKADVRLVVELLRTEVWKREERSGTKGAHSRSRSTSKNDPPKARKIEVGTASTSEANCDWLRMIGDCPQGILDMLNSRSCRSAIMFNDELTLMECRTLVSRLAACKFPFQCAHGRPSMIPLVDLTLPAAMVSLNTSGDDQSTMLKAFRASDAYENGSSREFVIACKRWKNNVALSDMGTASD